MITFDLRCEARHRFEGWFRNRDDFDRQLDHKMIACPLCGSTRIEKALSAVAVHVGRSSAPVPRPSEASGAGEDPKPSSPPVPEIKSFVRELARFVETSFEDVGDGFAKEARKIHRGEVDARNIRGTTTDAEETSLRDEGVEFLKVPVPKFDA